MNAESIALNTVCWCCQLTIEAYSVQFAAIYACSIYLYCVCLMSPRCQGGAHGRRTPAKIVLAKIIWPIMFKSYTLLRYDFPFTLLSALEVIFNVMPSINPRFTYLLTYLFTYYDFSLCMNNIACFHSFPMNHSRFYTAFCDVI